MSAVMPPSFELSQEKIRASPGRLPITNSWSQSCGSPQTATLNTSSHR
jgi:hypothetical protein